MAHYNHRALDCFNSGMNCAQAVLAAFSDDLNFDNLLAMQISSGFGGGMGRLQGTCGAVTGAFMVLGIYTSGKYSDIDERKDLLNVYIQELNARFTAIHSTSNCAKLLGIDLKTPEGRQTMQDQNLSQRICCKCISDSVDILADIIKLPVN